MKKKRIFSLFCLLSFLNVSTASAQDLFMGTIIQKDQDFYLKRCDLGAKEYLIESQNSEIFVQLKQFQQSYPTYWLSVLAKVDFSDNQVLKLNVDQIIDIHPHRSCHLSDALDHLTNLDTTDN
ncbi:hypothetical protein A7A69_13790 [Acinetobacter sp. Ac_1271]|nr:hypothetical protein [Acinetobacter guerrae]